MPKEYYSTSELKEFKALINSKLEIAKETLESLNDVLSKKGNGTDDTSWSYHLMEDGAETLSKEETSLLAQRQRKFIESLQHALSRIENKTYGICRITGKLIPRERLLAVPHATTSINEKKIEKKSSYEKQEEE